MKRKELWDTELHEIAIQRVRTSNLEDWAGARAVFLEKLRATPGVEADWTFRAFFSMPEPDPEPVWVGITRWTSAEHFLAARDALGGTPEAAALFANLEMLAFVGAHAIGAAPLRLETILEGPAPVLEVAVRRLKPGVTDEEFADKRGAFFGAIAEQPGYLFDRELVDAYGRRVVLIGWSGQEAFGAALHALSTRPEMGAFFGILEVEAYQAAVLAP